MNRRERQQGATMVEFALVAGLFFTLVLGALQFGSWLMDRTVMMNAALEGARVFSALRHYATPYTRTLAAVNASLPGNMKVPQRTTMVLSVTPPKGSPTSCTDDESCRKLLGTASGNPPSALDCLDTLPPSTTKCTSIYRGTTASVTLTMTTPIFARFGLPGSMSATMSELVQGANKDAP